MYSHIRPRKIFLVQNQVTTEYCCEWLLFTLGSRLLQGSGRGYHDVPKIKATNRQMNCTYKVRKMSI